MRAPLSYPAPIWLSRKTADGRTIELAVPVWSFALVSVMAVVDVIAWELTRLVEVGRVIA